MSPFTFSSIVSRQAPHASPYVNRLCTIAKRPSEGIAMPQMDFLGPTALLPAPSNVVGSPCFAPRTWPPLRLCRMCEDDPSGVVLHGSRDLHKQLIPFDILIDLLIHTLTACTGPLSSIMPRCTRSGCGQDFNTEENAPESCVYHPGAPVRSHTITCLHQVLKQSRNKRVNRSSMRGSNRGPVVLM
jgi:hypothetical protein